MKCVNYKLRISGLSSPSGTIKVRALLDLLQGLTECAERGLRLALEGASIKTGRPPVWLQQAVNLTVSGLRKGSTILNIQAPTIGHVIGSELQQQDFWLQAPSADDTALSLFAKSVSDATAENLESDYYDAGVLRALLNLKPFLKQEAKRIELISVGRPQEHVSLSLTEMEKAERLKIRTPEPRSFFVSGRLDAIQHSRKRLQLMLPTGEVVPGRIDEEHLSAEQLRKFWGKDVTIRGTVHFRPSGRIQLIEAQLIKSKEAGEDVFSELPRVQTEAEFISETTQVAEKRDWLKHIWGKWPGDEPIEELMAELKR